jgi:hypothetical protein
MRRHIEQMISKLSQHVNGAFSRSRERPSDALLRYWRGKSVGVAGALSRYARAKTEPLMQVARSRARAARARRASRAQTVEASHDFCKRSCVAVDPNSSIID